MSHDLDRVLHHPMLLATVLASALRMASMGELTAFASLLAAVFAISRDSVS